MEERNRKASWYLTFNRLVLLLLEIGHFLQILLLQNESLEAIVIESIHFLKVVLAVIELIVVHPSEACNLLLVVQEELKLALL